MNTRDRLSFKNIFIRFPWFKIVLVFVVCSIIIMDLAGNTISRIGIETPHPHAPMLHHVRIRDLDGKKLVSLTFDDGPSADTTPELLDILHQKSATVTFFMLGSRAANNPNIVERAEREGHVVASHTMYHQNFAKISAAATNDDIAESKAVFNDIIRHVPSLTRPPYGNITNTVRDAVGTPIILWSVDTLDWKIKNPDSISEITHEQVYDGAIILMHDIYETSVEAAARLIDELRAEDYEFVTVPELAKYRGVDLKNGAVYYSFRP